MIRHAGKAGQGSSNHSSPGAEEPPVNGVVPSGTITVRYKTGGGAMGNINAGTLIKLEGSFNARRLPAVARALMLTLNEDRAIAENTGILFAERSAGDRRDRRVGA